MADSLGDDFTDEHDGAWRAAYANMSATMFNTIERARGGTAASPAKRAEGMGLFRRLGRAVTGG